MVLHTPVYLIYKLRKPGVAFLVHPRHIEDIYRPFPAFKWLPESWVHRFGRKIGPITLSRMNMTTGNGFRLRAELLSLVMTPSEMNERKNRAELNTNIRLLYLLASRKNIYLVGLGAWLPYLTKYGKRLLEIREASGGPAITTGHALTAWCIRETLLTIAKKRHASSDTIKIGVVGAAGSTGSLTARLLSNVACDIQGLSLHLVDRRKSELEKLASDLSSRVTTSNSTELHSLQDCDYVIVVTNAEKAILRPEHVKTGAVIIDDSQPRNSRRDLLDKAYVIDVLARVPGLDVKFDFGFQTDDTAVTFSCLAETILIGLVGQKGDFSFGNAVSTAITDQLEQHLVDIERLYKTSIRPAHYFTFERPMTKDVTRELLREVITSPTEIKAAE